MLELYTKTCASCSELITKEYSTSFSLGIRMFDKRFREPIYGVYGFVRLADEIVDTFHDYNKKELLDKFKEDTFEAIAQGISLNPVLHSFQKVVNEYGIGHDLIISFLDSMYMDLEEIDYSEEQLNKYIYGSAEVVGLMCMRIFCEGDHNMYDRLLEPARSLGAAFQKINFLRDIQSDFDDRGRTYFPGINVKHFTEDQKQIIERDIKEDFDHAYLGICQLPHGAKLGVYLAYRYYLKLYAKIKNAPAAIVAQKRIRVNNSRKMVLLAKSAVRHKLNLI